MIWLVTILGCLFPVYFSCVYLVFKEMTALYTVKQYYDLKTPSYFILKAVGLSLIWFIWIWFPYLRDKWI